MARSLRSKCAPWKKRMASYMKRNMTWPEKILWKQLRDKKLGYKFDKQVVLRGFIADFYCAEKKIIVEADGPTHYTQEGIVNDKVRDLRLAAVGIKTIRFSASDIKSRLPSVVAMIKYELLRR
jgi:very-short-patch-repair endonuclease